MGLDLWLSHSTLASADSTTLGVALIGALALLGSTALSVLVDKPRRSSVLQRNARTDQDNPDLDLERELQHRAERAEERLVKVEAALALCERQKQKFREALVGLDIDPDNLLRGEAI